jgi:F1F0 ATPase subunit 2
MTVHSLVQSGHPALIMLFSFIVRMAVVLLVFYLLAIKLGWISVLIGLAGMILVRMVLIRKFSPERGRMIKKDVD